MSHIDIVSVDQLGARLGLPHDICTPLANLSKDFVDFKMEREDAPVFRFLYRNLNPRRHLEFGTWEGFGVTLCASECAAEIWTINAPGGERGTDGTSAYTRHFETGEPVPAGAIPVAHDSEGTVYQTDSGVFIGWLYRAAGYEDRVHQICCDSRMWSPELPSGHFDTVLIDGGHTPDVVRNDTEKALALLRSGGICMWHDFCPDPEVLRRMPASYGVAKAIHDNFSAWRPKLNDLFWITPTFLLLGVKA